MHTTILYLTLLNLSRTRVRTYVAAGQFARCHVIERHVLRSGIADTLLVRSKRHNGHGSDDVTSKLDTTSGPRSIRPIAAHRSVPDGPAGRRRGCHR
jgi:hypothetical protein